MSNTIQNGEDKRFSSGRVAAVLLGAITLLGAGVVRNHLGAGTSNVSLPGTGVVVTYSGDAGTLDAAGAADGAVVAIVGGVPTLTTVSTGTSQPTTYYASDGTATVGGAGTSASISGTGSASTVTLGVPASPSTATTTSSTEGGPRWCSPGISQGAQRAVLYLRSTAISNFATGGWRWSTATLRRTNESPPASLYLGASWSDSSTYAVGNMRSGSNSATYWLGSIAPGAPTSPTEGADRWLRVVWTLADGVFKVHLATGATTGSTRPTYWVPRTATAQEQPSSVTSVGSPGTSTLTICVGLETFGSTGGASSVTYSLALEVTS